MSAGGQLVAEVIIVIFEDKNHGIGPASPGLNALVDKFLWQRISSINCFLICYAWVIIIENFSHGTLEVCLGVQLAASLSQTAKAAVF